MKKPLLILTADWHLTESTPICRTDDFIKAQWDKVKFIKQLQAQLKCPVFHAGDLYHHWKPSPALLSLTIENLPSQFYTIYGNHDLPQHSYALRHKSGIYTLAKAGALTAIAEGSWNYREIDANPEGVTIGFWMEKSSEIEKMIGIQHVFIYHGEKPWAGCEYDSALAYMKKNSTMDLIITGDNHTSFVVKRKDQILVNPGCITRQSASSILHQPCVYVYYNDHTVEQVFLPYNKDVISTEHLTTTVEKQKRIEAFISRLKTESVSEISFEENLEIFFTKNKIKPPIKQLIYNSLEE